MTQLSRVEAGAANFALNGAGWTTVSRVDASGGSYSTNTTAGRTATITTPIGTTTTFLGYTARPDAPGNVSYQVDSGPVVTWDQRGLSTMLNDAEYYWYRALSPPISIPNDGGTHIITVTCGTGTTALDFVEHYSPSGATAGKLLTFGHSIAAGFSPAGAGDPVNPIPQRFSALVAAYLSTTDANNVGIPSEDLTNGGITAGADNLRYYNNTAVITPAWRRAETGTQWWAATPRYALIHHGLNDVGYTGIYDGGLAIPVGNRDAAGHATAPAAGTGYAEAQYRQRFYELLWRMNANVPQCDLFVAGICLEVLVDNASTVGTSGATSRQLWNRYNAIMAACCTAATVTNASFVDTLAPTTGVGGAAIMCSDNAHPNTSGHLIIANEIIKRMDAVYRRPATYAGVR